MNYNSNIVIVGDINVDLLTEKSHRMFDFIRYYQLTNVVHGLTHFGITRNSLLDPVLVKECSVGMCEVVDIDRNVSDHIMLH